MPNRTEIKLTIGTNVIQTGVGHDWILSRITGESYPEYSVPINEYADDDGGYTTNKRYAPRYIRLWLMSRAGSSAIIDATELLLREYLDIEATAEITVYKHGVERNLYAGTVAAVEQLKEKWTHRPYISITLLFPDPWMLGESIENTFRSSIPLLTFPWNSVVDVGITSGLVSSGDTATVTNSGHKETGFVLTLTANDAVTNPKVENASGLFVEAIASLSAGETVAISTVRGNKYVRKNGVFCPYNLSSTFFSLARGDNVITVSTTAGTVTKSLIYSERYRGV